jgi:hypothetical protein
LAGYEKRVTDWCIWDVFRRRDDYCILDVMGRYDKRRLREHDRTWWGAWRNGVLVAVSAALIPGVIAVLWWWVQ